MSDAPEARSRAHQLVEASRQLFTAGVMSHSGHANLSVRLDADRFLLTPGFVRDLEPQHLATVGLDGQLLEGELRSVSAEIITMHSVVYRARPHVGAIIHTHSPSATAFAVAHRPLPCRTEPMLRFGQPEEVPVVPWGPRGSDVSIRGIADVLDRRPTTSSVLLANHGLLVFGPDAAAAAHLVVAIEESAEAEIAAAAIGGAVDFPEGALEAVRASIARVSA
ncbi:class II aldolase/adducin family protein [Kitasatospora sp. NPDC051170]|uniref:class II aldolase/adducin family protein n=1 Tax=Kitasatospora sp. NPDC051170 TaxID=3364056 RepID=UPI00378BA7EF